MADSVKTAHPLLLAEAYHEWASVIDSLAAGEQTILLRKGGIHDPGGRFRPDFDRFLLYPTFTHQQATDLRKPWSERPMLAPSNPSMVTLTHWAETVEIFNAPPPESAEAWREFHIYTPELIQRRYEYKSNLPLYLLLTRVYRLAAPVTLPEPEGHRACVSWVHFPEPIQVDRALPALDDKTFEAKAAALREKLA